MNRARTRLVAFCTKSALFYVCYRAENNVGNSQLWYDTANSRDTLESHLAFNHEHVSLKGNVGRKRLQCSVAMSNFKQHAPLGTTRGNIVPISHYLVPIPQWAKHRNPRFSSARSVISVISTISARSVISVISAISAISARCAKSARCTKSARCARPKVCPLVPVVPLGIYVCIVSAVRHRMTDEYKRNAWKSITFVTIAWAKIATVKIIFFRRLFS